MSIRLAREAAMCLLYQEEITKHKDEGTLEVMADVLKTDKLSEKHRRYIDELRGIFADNQDEVDALIARFSEGWDFERISRVDLSIMRLAITEMLYIEDMPIKVSINEALEMAKKFSGEKSSAYVNGVLGGIVKEKKLEAAL